MFALVKPILSSVDLAICHLETPIVPADEELSTFPFFGVPIEITDALAYAGFDRCSTASNHAMDRGARGIDATLNALDRVGISHTGMARTPQEINPKLILVNGISIAHMSYTFSYNGLPAANGESWRSALIDTDRILRDVRLARKLGAQVVLLSMHWGNERESAPSSYQTKIADAITRSGEVNLIIGSHAHVLQPIKLVNGTFVIYGLGNFLSDMPTTPKDPPWPASTQDGAIVTATITVAANGKVFVAQPVVSGGHGFNGAQKGFNGAQLKLVFAHRLKQSGGIGKPQLAGQVLVTGGGFALALEQLFHRLASTRHVFLGHLGIEPGAHFGPRPGAGQKSQFGVEPVP